MPLSRGPAKRVTICVNEDTRHHTEVLWTAIVRYLRNKHVAGATVLRPVEGFGAHGIIHSTDQEIGFEHMPMRIEFIDTAEKVDELLPTLYEMVEDGIIDVQDTQIVKAAIQTKQSAAAPAPHVKTQGPGKLIRIYLSEGDKLNGEPLFEAIVKRLAMLEAAGATVYRGILGYGASRHTHKETLFHIPKDLPVMVSVVEQASRVDEILEALAPMLQDGLIVISDVELHRFVHASPTAS